VIRGGVNPSERSGEKGDPGGRKEKRARTAMGGKKRCRGGAVENNEGGRTKKDGLPEK